MKEVGFKLHRGRASGNVTTMKATLMKVIAIGFRFKSRSFVFFQSFTHWNVKAIFPKPSVFPRATFHRSCSRQSAGIRVPAQGWANVLSIVICWLCIWTCWHHGAPCWGCSSRQPRRWSCNAAMLTCWRQAGARRTHWTGPLNRGTKHQPMRRLVRHRMCNSWYRHRLNKWCICYVVRFRVRFLELLDSQNYTQIAQNKTTSYASKQLLSLSKWAIPKVCYNLQRHNEWTSALHHNVNIRSNIISHCSIRKKLKTLLKQSLRELWKVLYLLLQEMRQV